MDEELKVAIDRLNTLLKERNSPEWWSDNIIDASKDLKKKKNWTKFYSYMSNPEAFDHTVEHKTIEEVDEKPDLEYPDELEEIRYMNGPDTIIHVKRKVDDEEYDEKEQS